MSLNAFAQINHEDFFSLDREMKGIKKITEQKRSKWKEVSFFDESGFLLRKVNYHRNKIKADFRYEYSISDTLLEIKWKESQNANNNPEEYFVYKYHYNLLRQCYRVESSSFFKGLGTRIEI